MNPKLGQVQTRDGPPSHWMAGAQIVYREIWRGQVWTAMPVTVVQDTPDLIVLYLKAGTSWKLPQGDNFLRLLQVGDWNLRDVVAAGDSLFLIPPGEAYAIRTMGGMGDRAFKGWYVNLQEPVRRTRLGFDFMDHALDIIVAPDLSSWHWHDEDELLEAQARGLFSARLVQQIRMAGDRVIGRLQDQAFSFMDGWEKWSPPDGPIPSLPEGWKDVK